MKLINLLLVFNFLTISQILFANGDEIPQESNDDTQQILQMNEVNQQTFSTLSTSSSRVLLVVAELDSRGVPEYKKIYKSIEKIAYFLPMAEFFHNKTYREIHVLNNGKATLQNFKSILFELADNPTNKTIDVILALHGRPQKLAFIEKSYSNDEIKKELIANEFGQESIEQKSLLKQKLRLMYNLSCYGQSHNSMFLDLGFKVVIGSVAANANGEVEYPSFLNHWRRGHSVNYSLAWAMKKIVLDAVDLPLKWFGIKKNNFLKYIDSRKIVEGQSNLTINSET